MVNRQYYLHLTNVLQMRTAHWPNACEYHVCVIERLNEGHSTVTMIVWAWLKWEMYLSFAERRLPSKSTWEQSIVFLVFFSYTKINEAKWFIEKKRKRSLWLVILKPKVIVSGESGEHLFAARQKALHVGMKRKGHLDSLFMFNVMNAIKMGTSMWPCLLIIIFPKPLLQIALTWTYTLVF